MQALGVMGTSRSFGIDEFAQPCRMLSLAARLSWTKGCTKGNCDVSAESPPRARVPARHLSSSRNLLHMTDNARLQVPMHGKDRMYCVVDNAYIEQILTRWQNVCTAECTI